MDPETLERMIRSVRARADELRARAELLRTLDPKIIEHALSVFEDEASAAEWLTDDGIHSLQYKSAVEHAATEKGSELVSRFPRTMTRVRPHCGDTVRPRGEEAV